MLQLFYELRFDRLKVTYIHVTLTHIQTQFQESDLPKPNRIGLVADLTLTFSNFYSGKIYEQQQIMLFKGTIRVNLSDPPYRDVKYKL